MAGRREKLIVNHEVLDGRRSELGLSLDRLARRADVSVSTVTLMHRGAIVGPESRRRIAAALGLDEGALFRAYDALARSGG
jgi:transcriptional regulator with XRE-family HTH domain